MGRAEAAKDAPYERGLDVDYPGSGGAARDALHLLRLPSSGLPPRGLDYGRLLDKRYMAASTECFLEDVDVYFDDVTGAAEAFASKGDVAEASRIYEAVAETVAKNFCIVDDSGAHYGESLAAALADLAKCMDAGRAGAKMPPGARKSRISWLVRRVAIDDPDFLTCEFASALDAACASKSDAAWRKRRACGAGPACRPRPCGPTSALPPRRPF